MQLVINAGGLSNINGLFITLIIGVAGVSDVLLSDDLSIEGISLA
ncbi:hypothetical protein [Moritella sp. 36]|nr:hypothetical protein [Moritella sp. 36]